MSNENGDGCLATSGESSSDLTLEDFYVFAGVITVFVVMVGALTAIMLSASKRY